jgi:hypothetical protein
MNPNSDDLGKHSYTTATDTYIAVACAEVWVLTHAVGCQYLLLCVSSSAYFTMRSQ